MISACTNMPYVYCAPETYDDEVFVYFDKAEANEGAKWLLEGGNPIKLAKVGVESRLAFFTSLYPMGVNAVCVDKEFQSEAVFQLNHLVHRQEAEKMPKGHIRVENPDGRESGCVRLTVNGEEITKPSPERGMVFQKPTLFPWLTVEKNISFSLRMQGKYKGNEERVARMLRLIGLEEFKDDYPGQLSGGMAQRVALVRTLINQPDILLLDEPLGALDAFTRMNMQDEILAMWRSRRQLAVMVTHDVDEAIYMGTRILVMDAAPGRILADIKIDEGFPRDRSSASFVAYRNDILHRLHFGKKQET